MQNLWKNQGVWTLVQQPHWLALILHCFLRSSKDFFLVYLLFKFKCVYQYVGNSSCVSLGIFAHLFFCPCISRSVSHQGFLRVHASCLFFILYSFVPNLLAASVLQPRCYMLSAFFQLTTFIYSVHQYQRASWLHGALNVPDADVLFACATLFASHAPISFHPPLHHLQSA